MRARHRRQLAAQQGKFIIPDAQPAHRLGQLVRTDETMCILADLAARRYKNVAARPADISGDRCKNRRRPADLYAVVHLVEREAADQTG